MERLVRSPRTLAVMVLALVLAACAPAAPPPPTADPAKPTEAPAAKPTEAPKPAAKPTEAAAAKPAASPAAKAEAKPAEAKPAASPVAKPAEAKPAAKFDAKAVEAFYAGKTLKILVGFSAGGPADIVSRLVAKYLPDTVPGKPNTLVENRPGAAALLVANQTYNTEPKDGTVLGQIASGGPLLQALGRPGVEYDARRFQWLGNVSKTVSICSARTDSGVNRVEDIVGPTAKELVVGAIGPGTGTHDTPTTLNATIGSKFKIVSGYGGTANIALAVENKEVAGMCANLDTKQSAVPQFFQGSPPTLKVIVVMGDRVPSHPWLAGVPPATNFARTEGDKQIINAVAAGPLISWAFAVAPGVPQDRVEALRKGLMDVFANPRFVAEAKQAGFDVDPFTGQELAEIVDDTLNISPDTLARLKEILK